MTDGGSAAGGRAAGEEIDKIACSGMVRTSVSPAEKLDDSWHIIGS